MELRGLVRLERDAITTLSKGTVDEVEIAMCFTLSRGFASSV
jgi:hypothetical protein